MTEEDYKTRVEQLHKDLKLYEHVKDLFLLPYVRFVQDSTIYMKNDIDDLVVRRVLRKDGDERFHRSYESVDKVAIEYLYGEYRAIFYFSEDDYDS